MSKSKKNSPFQILKGTVGEVTFYERDGKQCVRKRTTERTTPSQPSTKQQKTRMTFANTLRLYRRMPSPIKSTLCFAPVPGRTTFNAFTSANNVLSNRWLPKTLVKELGCCMPFEGLRYAVGNLRRYDGEFVPVWSGEDDPNEEAVYYYKTRLKLGGDTVPATLGELNRELLDFNGDLYEDAYLRIVYVTIPDIEFPLPNTYLRTAYLGDLDYSIPSAHLSPNGEPLRIIDGCLALPVGSDYSVALWWCYKASSRWECSDGALHLNPTIADAWTGDEAFETAAESWGWSDEADEKGGQ